jgi:hypothetical protein
MNKFLDNFTNQYKLTKTIGFELVPVGKTLEHIKNKGLLEKDVQHNSDFLKVKTLLDEIHKNYINDKLSDFKFDSELLSIYQEIFLDTTKEKEERELELERITTVLRNEMASTFGDNPCKNLTVIILTRLPKYLREQGRNDEVALVEQFKRKIKHFDNYNITRENIYTGEKKANSIAYRTVNENLPIFVNNITIYNKIKDILDLTSTESELSTELGAETLDSFFTLDNFNFCLSQSGIELHNAVIGGQTKESRVKIKGLNELINLYNQTKGVKKLPRFKKLNKQLLSDREQLSYIPSKFTSTGEVMDSINNVNEVLTTHLDAIQDLFGTHITDTEGHSGIWYDVKSLKTLSNIIFKEWHVIPSAVEKYKKKVKNHISLTDLIEAVELYVSEDTTRQNHISIVEHLTGITTLVDKVRTTYLKTLQVEQVIGPDRFTNAEKKTIKEHMDSLSDLNNALKVFQLPEDVEVTMVKDQNFYDIIDNYLPISDTIIKIYNNVRNFTTTKPYSEEKVKLFFENGGNFLDGFTESMTEKSKGGTQYGGYLFRKPVGNGEYDYFLGVSSHKHLFSFTKTDSVEDGDVSEFERLNYYQLKSSTLYKDINYNEDVNNLESSMMRYLLENGASDLVKKLSLKDTIGGFMKKVKDYDTKNGTKHFKLLRSSSDLRTIEQNIIIKLKNRLVQFSTRVPKLLHLVEKEYDSLTDLNDDIPEILQYRSFNYAKISKKEMESALSSKSKTLLLFQIMNKDLKRSPDRDEKKRGRDNLHTMYFKHLMSGEQNTFDIGEGAIFYRPGSIKKENATVHPANVPLDNKNPDNPNSTSTFTHDIIKDKRYTEDKFLFKLSIFMNYRATGSKDKQGAFNKNLNTLLSKNPGVNVIGIDRGEKNLIYYTVTDKDGIILEQDSLNVITNIHKNQEYKFDYHKKLDTLQHDRNRERKSWDDISNIKNMKSGFVSQAVHKIAELVVKYDAIIVMENLNDGFKRGRIKIEKQVYQNFEKALIDKLSYLVFKDRKPTEPGGVLNAYQFTAPFKSFQELNKQTGIIFYVDARNTSKIDPLTGFTNRLWPKYDNLKESRDFFSSMENISYDTKKDCFVFTVDYNLTRKEDELLNKGKWDIHTNGLRYVYDQKTRENKEVDVTGQIKTMMSEVGIDHLTSPDLKEDIILCESASFHRKLTNLLRTVLEMRYTDNEGTDFILSPVCDKNGNFFDTRFAKEGEPKDPDANGAFNIALKGVMTTRRLSEGSDIYFKHVEWLNMVTDRCEQKMTNLQTQVLM